MVMIKRGRNKRRQRWLLINVLLVLIVSGLCVGMLMLGNTIYPVRDVVRSLYDPSMGGVSFAVATIRLPRLLAGFFAGIAFGMAGHTFQTMLRNPLANPDVLGITTGSSVAALFCLLIFQTNQTTASLYAVIAGLLTVIVIYLLAWRKTFSIGRLILVGLGIQAMLNAVISYLLLVGNQQDIPAALRWLSGSLNGAQLPATLPLIWTVVICAPLLILLGNRLNILELGEESAISLGVKTNRTRLLLIVCAVAMLAVATASTGPIAFVAFLSGPIAQRLVGGGYANIVTAGLIGAILVLAADLLGQFAFGVRYPVGIVTGMLGAPYLLILLIKMNRRGRL